MKKNQEYFSVKDHSVSGEVFQLLYNSELDMLETHPKPLREDLPKYYKTENYISHTDGRRNLFEKGYQFVKKITLKRKLKLINAYSSQSKLLLDVGCGTGDFLKIAKENNWKVAGIEPNEGARQIANLKTGNNVFENDQLLKFKPETFDVITLWHVLEHLPNLEEHIAIFKKLLKSNGTLVIAVPNFKSFDASYYKEFWAAFDVPRHLWHFSRTAIKKIVANEKMQVAEIIPMTFDAYYVSLLSEKYKSGVMNPFKAFWIACRSNFAARSTKEYSSLIYVIKNS